MGGPAQAWAARALVAAAALVAPLTIVSPLAIAPLFVLAALRFDGGGSGGRGGLPTEVEG